MKSIISKTATLLAICAAMSSFSPKPGGEGFEIYLGNKLLTQQFGSKINDVKSLQLSQSSYNDELTIKYYHCGKAGKNRSVTIKDGQNNVLKVFHFSDAAAPVAAMTVKVKDILNLTAGPNGKKGNNITLKLYYSSTELPGGRLLASIVTGNTTGTNP